MKAKSRGSVDDERPTSIPWTAMATRYKDLKKQHAERLRQLAYDLADPTSLIADFVDSRAAFETYKNAAERFYDPDKREPLPRPNEVHDLRNGRAVMAKIKEAGTFTLLGGERTYLYVDYELVPTRTTPGKIRFDNDKGWQSAMRLDMLLAIP